MSIYAPEAESALLMITEAGGIVSFPGTATSAVYDGATDTWSGSPSSDATGRAVQIDSDPDRFRALGLTLANSVTLLIAALNLSVTPRPGMYITWAGITYSIKDVEAVAPDGVPIMYTVIGVV